MYLRKSAVFEEISVCTGGCTMNHTFEQFRSYAKRVFAAVLFTIMLVGASAAALSLVSAAITTLSGVYGTKPAVVAAVSTDANSSSPQLSNHPQRSDLATTAQPQLSSASQSDVETTPQDLAQPSLIDSLNEQADRLQSPIEHSLDHGGLALGARVHQTFGRMLSGVLQTLFLDTSTSPQTGDQP